MPDINTEKVAGRRVVKFNRLPDILADVDMLANAKQLRNLGNWPPGQVLNHLATVMNKSIDGFRGRAPWLVRFFVQLLFKNRFLTKPMSPGFRLPARIEDELVPPAVSLEEGMENFRRAYQRLQTETPRGEHPALGVLTPEQWEQLHCRHSELHLSFLVPGD